ncbi:DUF6932 family protein [Rhodoblastus acidophilus]|uniref:DUF6932 family protein n=1 Tax=Rhodoblastus acidophilus TaxID=1074 RepID=UPI001130EB66|nr:hypothetical protein [Rhodoblastus acidophilus]
MFNSKGYLDPGLHPMGLDEIEKNLVTPFPHSSTRKVVMDGFRRHTDELKAIIAEYIQLIDGSFASNKNDPGDIDLVCFIDGDKVDALPPDLQMKLRNLLLGKQTKNTRHCDAYFCPSYPDTHPNFEAYRANRKYWMGEFGYDRTDVPKGIVVVEQKAAPATLSASSSPSSISGIAP